MNISARPLSTTRRRTSKLCWIDGVGVLEDGRVGLRAFSGRVGAYVAEKVPFGQLETLPAFDVEDGRFPAAETRNVPVAIRDLSRLEPLLQPGPVIRSVFPKLRVTDNHVVFLHRAELPVLLPASLLIRALFGRSNLMKWLLVPHGLDHLALAAGRTAEEVSIETGAGLRSEQMTDAAYRTLAWLIHTKDGRTAWDSVLANALSERLAVTLPSASLECWARAVVTPSGLFVFELRGIEVNFRATVPSVRVISSSTGKERVIPSFVERPRSFPGWEVGRPGGRRRQL